MNKSQTLSPEEEKALIEEIEKKFGLLYLEEAIDGNVCFATNNSELRDDFKTSFSYRDLRRFILSFEGEAIVVPDTEKEFWKRAGERRGD